jgi:hypothetical protein
VLAQQRRGLDLDRRVGELDRAADRGERPALGVLDRDDHVVLDQRRVLDHLLCGQDRPQGMLCALSCASTSHLSWLIDHSSMSWNILSSLAAAPPRGPLRVVGQLGPADQLLIGAQPGGCTIT